MVDEMANSDGGQRSSEKRVDRRRLLQGLGGTVAISGLAGCNALFGGGGDETTETTPTDGGGGGGGGNQLGERVPEPLVLQHIAGAGSQRYRNVAIGIKQNVEAALDVEVETQGRGVIKTLGDMWNDTRKYDFLVIIRGSNPTWLDPVEIMKDYSIDWAGANFKANWSNYADCNFTKFAKGSHIAPSQEERQKLVNAATAISSKDHAPIALFPRNRISVHRNDMLELKDKGSAAFGWGNTHIYVNSNVKTNDNTLHIAGDTSTIATTNHLTQGNPLALAMWSTLPLSPLRVYDKNFQIQNSLAESVESSQGGKELTVRLRDATFHNGDPVTAEDVKFTFKYIWDNPGSFFLATNPGYESIDVVDDKTVKFILEQPALWVATREFAAWGIMHKKSWVEQGASDKPSEFEPDPANYVGSGPFKIESWEREGHLSLTPHDGHPVFKSDHSIFIEGFNDNASAIESMVGGNVMLALSLDAGNANRAKSALGDKVTTHVVSKFFNYNIHPSGGTAPAKFPELREAIGAAVDRQTLTKLAYGNFSDKVKPTYHSTEFNEQHPWRPPEDWLTAPTTNPSGDPEAARQALKDAGWGWDSEGNLRYPAGANTEPLWPKGEVPGPDKFPCVNDKGAFTGEAVTKPPSEPPEPSPLPSRR